MATARKTVWPFGLRISMFTGPEALPGRRLLLLQIVTAIWQAPGDSKIGSLGSKG